MITTPSPVDPAHAVELEQGRIVALRVIGLLATLSVAASALYVVNVGTDKLLQQAGRLLITLLLGLALFRGARWARNVILGLIVLSGLILVPGLLTGLGAGNLSGALFLLLVLAAYGWVALMLLRSKALAAFMASRRAAVGARAGAPA